MSRVDYCVTTMNRPHVLERLLLSIAAHRPEASVHVADQSESFDQAHHDGLSDKLAQAGLQTAPTIHRLPFDCGVSAARNHLVDSTPGEYKLILDDDFVFSADTDIDTMALLLDAHRQAGAVGGSVTRNGEIRNVGTRLERRGTSLYQLAAQAPFGEHAGIRFIQTDCVPVFVLMRRELCAAVRWDPGLKTAGEHFDFFLRMQETPYALLYAPDVKIDHPPAEMERSYTQLRWRGEFLQRMMNKHGLRRLVVLDGTVTELSADGEPILYCELDPRSPVSSSVETKPSRSSV